MHSASAMESLFAMCYYVYRSLLSVIICHCSSVMHRWWPDGSKLLVAGRSTCHVWSVEGEAYLPAFGRLLSNSQMLSKQGDHRSYAVSYDGRYMMFSMGSGSRDHQGGFGVQALPGAMPELHVINRSTDLSCIIASDRSNIIYGRFSLRGMLRLDTIKAVKGGVGRKIVFTLRRRQDPWTGAANAEIRGVGGRGGHDPGRRAAAAALPGPCGNIHKVLL